MSIHLGMVGHFGIAVRDVERSRAFWTRNFDLEEIFRFDDGVGLSNDDITIVLFKGEPHPETLDHLSFHLKTMAQLRSAMELLRGNGVQLEDPGDEIGPEAPGSPHMGLWFHDPEGYRWELSVQNGAKQS
jgi:catechol 2,3-dioxygenase-like lactoylglutathione lyase family enzyme